MKSKSRENCAANASTQPPVSAMRASFAMCAMSMGTSLMSLIL